MAVGPLGILGGVFDPPHLGHVALARAALRELDLAELLVLVIADPGHKATVTPAETRFELSRVAFEDVERTTVELDRHARTVDSLEERMPRDAVFVLGADELVAFESWKSPERIVELVRLGVAMRPGTTADAVRAVAARLAAPRRVLEFELEPLPISSFRRESQRSSGPPGSTVRPSRLRRSSTRMRERPT